MSNFRYRTSIGHYMYFWTTKLRTLRLLTLALSSPFYYFGYIFCYERT